ncbi:ADP-ribosylglycohydrolase family protein [Candidatus Desulforudis audaxviator]|uniref:ADP-ribosylation/Crystallin J1 n=1 Tax=Desulforudis audaxviator (strain MP104C) TaxID=477974 RepID=B1I1E1_DESAP|nr:ADP-ribosylation/Crystallin J1 [Candidatus Desulforudis audaxviator MP104C]
MKVNKRERILGGLFGVTVGDALGVPVEFVSREDLRKKPVQEMFGYGTHHQPPGTWSDDTSLTLCLVESLVEAGYNLADAGKRFVRWYREGYWTPYGRAFDIGGATRQAILRLEGGVDPALAGPDDEMSNGNGSLMRILPAALYFAESEVEAMREAVCKISCLTHGHQRSQLACFLYALLANELLAGNTPGLAYEKMRERAPELCAGTALAGELPHFERILNGSLPGLPGREIRSDGYVVSTLEAAAWCLLNNATFSDTVLSAVNLGGDSDTTGAVAGSLAGVYYGYGAIPRKWLERLARFEEILALFEKFASLLTKNSLH